jgi:sulfur carrier protein
VQITVNGQSREVATGVSVSELLEQLQLDMQHVAVEVNQQLVPRTDHGQRVLQEKDQVEVVTLVGGG